jgi:2'-5' RNA ligase
LTGVGRIFILAEIRGPVGERIHDIQRRFDPKLARSAPPHVTIAGSSGIGPVRAGTPVATIRDALEPVAAATAPMELRFSAPHRFMQTDIIVLPLDPHGPLRELHDGIARSGLRFSPARFTFTPHATLSFYPELAPDVVRTLLAERVDDAVTIDRVQVYRTMEPQPSVKLFELELQAPRVQAPGAGRHAP